MSKVRRRAQPNHQRASSAAIAAAVVGNRQPSSHLRSAVLSSPRHIDADATTASTLKSPSSINGAMKKFWDSLPRYRAPAHPRACDGHDGMWRGDPRPVPLYTGRRQTQHHKQDRPCPRRPRRTGRLGRSTKTRVARSPLCRQVGRVHLPPWREQRAHQPSGRTWRPSGDHCAQNRGLQTHRAASAWPYPASSRCTRCTRRQRPERVVSATISTIYRLALSAFSGICSSSGSSGRLPRAGRG